MKTISLFIFSLIFSSSIFAQANIITIDYNKLPTTAVTNSFTESKDIVMKALETKMASYKVKSKKSKGYMIYQGVIVPEISASPVDLYFKVDGNNKNGNVTMHISSGYEVFYNDRDNMEAFEGGKTFLNNLTTDVAAAKLNFDIKVQTATVKSSDKQLSKYKSELNKLQRQKKNIEDKIAKTERAIADAEATLRNEQKTSEQLKSQVE